MRYRIRVFFLAACIVLTGCVTKIRSEVTVFHEWPANLQERSFVFEQTPEQQNNLEYRSYQSLVREELLRLGFTESLKFQSAQLSVSMHYQVTERDVQVVEPVLVDPWYGPGFYGPYWPYYGYYPWAYPYWYGPPIVSQQESRYRLFMRFLRIGIKRASDGKILFDVTVRSEGTNSSLAAVMPYMIRSAFADFPGPSGVPRIIELKLETEPAESDKMPADSELYS